MTSRDEILRRVRRQASDASPLPPLDVPGITFDDPERRFADVLQSVGGETLHLADGADVAAELRKLTWFDGDVQVLSADPTIAVGNVSPDALDSPHALAAIDVAVVPGHMAVAENGAVWVSGRDLRQRAVCFLTQRLILVVPRAALVHNMHEAYARLRFDEPGYGVFVSGPSKTADIEQSLVIGAHGPRALIVVLVGPARDPERRLAVPDSTANEH